MSDLKMIKKASATQQRLINEIRKKAERVDIVNWKSGEVFGHFSDYNRKGSIESVKPKIQKVFPNCKFAVQENGDVFSLYVNYYNYYTVMGKK